MISAQHSINQLVSIVFSLSAPDRRSSQETTIRNRETLSSRCRFISLFFLLSGLVLPLLLGSCRRSSPAAEVAAPPQGVPVKLASVDTITLQDSSEFVGTLEARRAVVLRPEIDGRVSQIFVESGDTIAAGGPTAPTAACRWPHPAPRTRC